MDEESILALWRRAREVQGWAVGGGFARGKSNWAQLKHLMDAREAQYDFRWVTKADLQCAYAIFPVGCRQHGVWHLTTPYLMRVGAGYFCPLCACDGYTKVIGEQLVARYLRDAGIMFVPQFHGEGMGTTYYRIDFYCPTLGLMIEYDEEHHAEDEKVKEHDRIKEHWTRDVGLGMLRIPKFVDDIRGWKLELSKWAQDLDERLRLVTLEDRMGGDDCHGAIVQMRSRRANAERELEKSLAPAVRIVERLVGDDGVYKGSRDMVIAECGMIDDSGWREHGRFKMMESMLKSFGCPKCKFMMSSREYETMIVRAMEETGLNYGCDLLMDDCKARRKKKGGGYSELRVAMWIICDDLRLIIMNGIDTSAGQDKEYFDAQGIARREWARARGYDVIVVGNVGDAVKAIGAIMDKTRELVNQNY